MNSQKRIISTPLIFFLALLFFDFLILFLHQVWGKSIGFFNLDKEQNLISLYTGIKFWIGGTLAAFNFVLARKLVWAKMEKIIWLLTALGLFYIGLDDLYYLHERFAFVLNNALGTGGFYGESFNWLLYFSPLIIFGLLVFVKLIMLTWQKNRSSAIFTLVGTCLFILALATEIFGRQLLAQTPVPVATYRFFIVLEEAFELMGASAFVVGVALYFNNISKKFITIARAY